MGDVRQASISPEPPQRLGLRTSALAVPSTASMPCQPSSETSSDPQIPYPLSTSAPANIPGQTVLLPVDDGDTIVAETQGCPALAADNGSGDQGIVGLSVTGCTVANVRVLDPS